VGNFLNEFQSLLVFVPQGPVVAWHRYPREIGWRYGLIGLWSIAADWLVKISHTESIWSKGLEA
jgi:hypothetical protein